MRRLNAQLELAEELGRCGSWEWAPSTGELHWSPNLFRLYGLEPGAVEPSLELLERLLVAKDRQHFREASANLERIGRLDPLEMRVRHPDGSVRHLLGRAAEVSADESVARYVGSVEDRTEQLRSEDRLAIAYEYLRAVTDSIGQAVVTVDREGRLTYMNAAGEELFGWTQAELEGRLMHDAVHYRRPDGTPYPIEECPLEASRRRGEEVRVLEDSFIRKDGSSVPVEYTSRPFRSADGTEGSVVIISDASERREREHDLEGRLESLSWIGRIRDALAGDGFLVHAQPVIELGSGDVVSHELLIRMADGNGGVIPPGRFLPVAEEFSLIAAIDRWMLERAAELAGSGHAVSVNISAQSVGEEQLVTRLAGELNRHGAEPSLVVCELTETALLEEEHLARGFVAKLSELGVGLALDDFGTGYGGFTYLKSFNVDYLKIDREFVADVVTSQASRHVAKAVVDLAKGFGQRTIAEGVEDEETLDLLHELGVDMAQGFHLGRPVPVAEALGGNGTLLA